MLFEAMAGKSACLLGVSQDATPFVFNEVIQLNFIFVLFLLDFFSSLILKKKIKKKKFIIKIKFINHQILGGQIYGDYLLPASAPHGVKQVSGNVRVIKF